LLFSEGYHGASAESAVRVELCQEAMRLAALLLGNPLGATPASYALSALMCLDKARLPARLNASGKLNSLFDQDRSLWDQALVGEGLQLLELSAKGSDLSEYHVEAAISAVHATAPSMQETDWGTIGRLPSGSAIVRTARSRSYGQSLIRNALRTIPSTTQPSQNPSCGAVDPKVPVSIFRLRSG
jgi:predicted RNA polymerase sigma factor